MMLLPDQVKELVSSAYRALNPEMHVDLCWLAESVWPAAGPENHIHRLTDETPLTPYAIQLIRSGLADGRIAWDIVRTYQNFGLIKEESLPPKAVSKPPVESNLAVPVKTAEPTPVTETQPKHKHIARLARSAIFLAALAVASGCVLGVGIGMSFDIAKQLNTDGYRPARGAEFTKTSVGALCRKLRRLGVIPKCPVVKPGYWRPGSLAERLGVKRSTLSGWRRRGWVQAQRVGSRWMYWADQAELKRLEQLAVRDQKKFKSPPEELTAVVSRMPKC